MTFFPEPVYSGKRCIGQLMIPVRRIVYESIAEYCLKRRHDDNELSRETDYSANCGLGRVVVLIEKR